MIKIREKGTDKEFIKQVHLLMDLCLHSPNGLLEGRFTWKVDKDLNEIITIKLKSGLKL